MKNTKHHSCGMAAVVIALGSAMGTGPAEATNGYFANGYNPQQKGLAGAGTAIDTGIMGMAVNPALGFGNANAAEACISAFSPDRDVTIAPGGPLTPGTHRSNNQFFPIPCGGANWQLNDRTTLGFVVYGNGGMNTEYDTNFFAGFGAGSSPLGVDLMQLFISPTLSYSVDEALTVGVAPVFAVQGFRAYGLEAFAGLSSNPAAVTNNGTDWSYGAGINLGLVWSPNENLTFGAAYRSRIFMTEFDDYAGLFAEQGDFDIPAQATLGVAFKVSPDLTLTAEYQHIWYGSIDAIANPQTAGGFPLGGNTGAGFGWKDMDVFRVGAQYRASDQLTLRGGVSYATEFTDPSEVIFNTLAPATPRWHVGVGATWNMDANRSLSVSYTRTFSQSLTGSNPVMTGGAVQPATLRMDQHELAFGMAWAW